MDSSFRWNDQWKHGAGHVRNGGRRGVRGKLAIRAALRVPVMTLRPCTAI